VSSESVSYRTIGIIGLGNVGMAMARGWLGAPYLELELTVCDVDVARVAAAVEAGGSRVKVAASPSEAAQLSDAVIVAVKPKDLEGVLGGLAGVVGSGDIVISTAAGVELEELRSVLGPSPSLYRIMPNLAVAVGQGAIALAPAAGSRPEEAQGVVQLLGLLGLVETLPEAQFNTATALGGSGPGFLALILEALEDGAVRMGMDRAIARRIARQMALGTAHILLPERGSSAELKDRVATPGGTTIAGLAVLEDRAVRGAVLRAVEAAAERGKRL